jgi:predicted O-methyltransferase YrrM
MIGVNGAEIENQLHFLRECCTSELIEKQKADIYIKCCRENGEKGYGPIESDFLYCFIYTKRPKKIIQIGCGLSTAVMMLAAKEADYFLEIICIDPYPNEFLRLSCKSGKIKLIQKKTQLVDVDVLTRLNDNDLLFIDSTHTVKPGSEVNKLILEVLPRLQRGCWVHFHDIHFPYDYSRHILTTDLFFSNESVLLHSFLINNNKFALKISLSMLHYRAPLELKKSLPNYTSAENYYGLNVSEGHFPSSAYLLAIS